MKTKFARLAIAAAALIAAGAVQAQIKVGIILSATGPAASLGSAQKRTVPLMPKEIEGKTIEYIVLDDASDTNQAVKAARKLMADEKVDVVFGPSSTPAALAVVDVAGELKTPLISMASSSRITTPMDANRFWVFKTPMSETLVIGATLKQAKAMGIKKLALITASDAYGDTWLSQINNMAAKYDVQVVASERFAPSDVTALAQVSKVMAAQPDAVLVAATGTPAVMPQKALRERGYAGRIFQTYGSLAPEVIKLGGKDMEGTLVSSSAGFVPSQLDPGDPIRLATEALKNKYEAMYGAGSWNSNAGNAWTASSLLNTALPAVLKAQQPGTPAFRAALRDQIEKTKEMGTISGFINMTPEDHSGYDDRAINMFEFRNGAWNLIKK
jgi:branched-chain amino acid transport system substrate-binding protein